MRKFRGSLDGLQELVSNTGIDGEWIKKSQPTQYRADSGAILNYWKSTGTGSAKFIAFGVRRDGRGPLGGFSALLWAILEWAGTPWLEADVAAIPLANDDLSMMLVIAVLPLSVEERRREHPLAIGRLACEISGVSVTAGNARSACRWRYPLVMQVIGVRVDFYALEPT
jgi:hypothetical protein